MAMCNSGEMLTAQYIAETIYSEPTSGYVFSEARFWWQNMEGCGVLEIPAPQLVPTRPLASSVYLALLV